MAFAAHATSIEAQAMQVGLTAAVHNVAIGIVLMVAFVPVTFPLLWAWSVAAVRWHQLEATVLRVFVGVTLLALLAALAVRTIVAIQVGPFRSTSPAFSLAGVVRYTAIFGLAFLCPRLLNTTLRRGVFAVTRNVA